MLKEEKIKKYNSLLKKQEANKELINWSKKLFKIFNLVVGSIFVLFGVSTIAIYMLFTSSITSVALATNILLPLCVSSFFSSAITGGILVFSNIILLVNKLVLNINGKNLNNRVKELSNVNINNEHEVQSKLLNDNVKLEKVNFVSKRKNNYHYVPSKNIEGNNFVMINDDTKVKKRVLKK